MKQTPDINPHFQCQAEDLFPTPFYFWFRSIVPGVVSISVVVGLRLMGALQGLELAALDAGLRLRSPEPLDDRVVIIGINEADIQAVGTYPIPDGVLAELLTHLQAYDAQVIGLDIVRDLPVEPGHDALVLAFKSMDNVIGAELVVPDREGGLISPPPGLPPEQVALIDASLDKDGHMRRAFLGSKTVRDDYQFSMAVRLAVDYLQEQDIDWGHGDRNPAAMRFGTVEMPQITPNYGSYVDVDAGGYQTLINFRSGAQPFRMLSLQAVLNGDVEPEWIRDRIVLIGITALSAKSGRDVAQTAAVSSSNPGLVFGVEIQAHVTSQIISAAMDGRSLLHSWPDGWEYVWIVWWGIAGLAVGRKIRSFNPYLLSIAILTLGLLGMGHGSLMLGWWLPTVPVLIIFLFNGVVLHAFYVYDQSIRDQVRDRQRIIDQSFAAIHNGPLQTLVQLMRQMEEVPDPVLSPQDMRQKLYQELSQLNYELRGIYAGMQREVTQRERLHLQSNVFVDLSLPLHELLHEVYVDTLQRDFPYFHDIKVNVVTFEPLMEDGLTMDQKRGLCRFLEEALCNVGKHAKGVKCLTVACHHDGTANVIRVIDNGIGLGRDPITNQDNDDDKDKTTGMFPRGLNPVKKQVGIITSHIPLADLNKPNAIPEPALGQGTQQAYRLAKQLGGKFERSPSHPRGTCCQLVWLPEKPIWQQLQQRISTLILRRSSSA